MNFRSSSGVGTGLSGYDSRSFSVLPIRKTPCVYTQKTLCLYAKIPRLYAKWTGIFFHGLRSIVSADSDWWNPWESSL